MKKIRYRIVIGSGDRYVTGYAVQLPHPFANFRVCVRKTSYERGYENPVGMWAIDHFDTGRSVNSESGNTILEAIANCHRYLSKIGIKRMKLVLKDFGVDFIPSK